MSNSEIKSELETALVGLKGILRHSEPKDQVFYSAVSLAADQIEFAVGICNRRGSTPTVMITDSEREVHKRWPDE